MSNIKYQQYQISKKLNKITKTEAKTENKKTNLRYE